MAEASLLLVSALPLHVLDESSRVGKVAVVSQPADAIPVPSQAVAARSWTRSLKSSPGRTGFLEFVQPFSPVKSLPPVIKGPGELSDLE